MIKLILKILALSIFVVTIYLLFASSILIGRDLKKSEESIFKKKIELLDAYRGRKIVILGGSNVLFGVDASRIELETGIKTINCGTNAGYGLHTMLNSIDKYLLPGDILILSPEYSNFLAKGAYYGGSELLKLVYNDPSVLKYVSGYNQFVNMVKYVPDFIFKYIYLDANTTNYNNNINANGDIAWDKIEIKAPLVDFKSEIDQDYFSLDAINHLNDFNIKLKKRNCKIYYEYPYIPDIIYNKNKMQINKLMKMISSIDIIQISDTEKSVLSQHYFFDTVYHLNPVGRILRTDRLLSFLREQNMGKQIVEQN